MLGEGGEVQLLLLLILLGGAPRGGGFLLLVAFVRLCRARRCYRSVRGAHVPGVAHAGALAPPLMIFRGDVDACRLPPAVRMLLLCSHARVGNDAFARVAPRLFPIAANLAAARLQCRHIGRHSQLRVAWLVTMLASYRYVEEVMGNSESTVSHRRRFPVAARRPSVARVALACLSRATSRLPRVPTQYD